MNCCRYPAGSWRLCAKRWANELKELNHGLEGEEGHAGQAVAATFGAVILQIMIVDMVFSLDSIITAVGMVARLAVMMAAVGASVLISRCCAARPQCR